MHRSSSTSRASEEFFAHLSSPSPSSKSSPGLRTEPNELPTYDPLSDVAKKERSRIRFAENAVHLIPFVLVICAIILWVFSNPAVDMMNKDDSAVPRIKGLSTVENDSGQTGLLTTLELEDLDPPKQMADHKNRKILGSKSE